MGRPTTPKPKRTLVALDTNVLIDLANGLDNVTDCISTFRQRAKVAVFVVPPTVIQELAYLAEDGQSVKERRAALLAGAAESG